MTWLRYDAFKKVKLFFRILAWIVVTPMLLVVGILALLAASPILGVFTLVSIFIYAVTGEWEWDWLQFDYRWRWGTVLPNLKSIFYGVECGIHNLIRWFPIVWHDVDFDESTLIEMMEFKCRKMARHHEKYRVFADWKRTARQLRMCELLCKRLREDNYSDNVRKFFTYGTRAWAKEWTALQKQDQEMLGRIIGKHLQSWWD